MFENYLFRPRGVWIGVSDIAEEGTWVWNSSGEKAAWRNGRLPWARWPAQPDGSGDCAFIRLGWNDTPEPGRWEDGWCLMELTGALCELPKI